MSSTDLSSTIYLTIYDLSNNPYAIGSTFTLTDNTNTFYFTYDSSSNVSGTNEFVFDVSYNTLGYTVTNSISTTTYSCQVTVGSLTYTITNAANISYNSNYDQVEIFLQVNNGTSSTSLELAFNNSYLIVGSESYYVTNESTSTTSATNTINFSSTSTSYEIIAFCSQSNSSAGLNTNTNQQDIAMLAGVAAWNYVNGDTDTSFQFASAAWGFYALYCLTGAFTTVNDA